jgi:uncharacterized protein YbjT (DUF2867 family)
VRTILVTGATGNVGSSLVAELADRGVAARAFVRDPDRAAAVLGPDVELAVGDFADPASIRAALDGVEVVFLACGNLPPQLDYETNVIDAAARAGVRRLVKLSALGAAPGSPVAFWDWHARIERHLEASGVPAVVLRPRYYMTNLLGFVETVRSAGAVFARLGEREARPTTWPSTPSTAGSAGSTCAERTPAGGGTRGPSRSH